MTTNYDLGFYAAMKEADRVALNLETRWRATANRNRENGRRWFFGWYTPTMIERDAKTIEAAANGIKAIRTVLANRKPVLRDGEA